MARRSSSSTGAGCPARCTAARAASTRRCVSCDIALTLHGDGRLHCHHCGFSVEMPEACPECGSVELARIGAGTQRLDAELARRLPGLERIRLDADTAARAGALARGARALRDGAVGRAHRDADGGERAPLPGCRGRRGRRRRRGSRVPRLPLGGADVPARDAARRPERPGRARARDRADVPARRDAVRATSSATTSPATSRTSSRGVRSSPTHLFHILFHSSSRDLTRAT